MQRSVSAAKSTTSYLKNVSIAVTRETVEDSD